MKQITSVFIAFVLIVSSAALMAAKEVKTKDFSGWMEDYDSLVFDKERNYFVFFNEEKRGQYEAILFDKVSIYSDSDEPNTKLGAQAADYLTAGCRDILRENGLEATQAGDKVARVHLAITGAEKPKEALKPYNLVPVSAIFRGAKAASGNLKTYIDVMFEGEMTDSVTGERLAAIVSKSITETEKKSGEAMTFDDLVPVLDLWLERYETTVKSFAARRK